ncbi:hypothetical protein [Ottowia sp.]|uniref:hypothetical protein n=1 Tax=Ottowia sp. TaxID=1898956 RepID=UPI0025F356AB|nr:hypothetical protein [Ottowia sp.]MBK6616752.1 hypothetical protein [Ottowia sp.]
MGLADVPRKTAAASPKSLSLAMATASSERPEGDHASDWPEDLFRAIRMLLSTPQKRVGAMKKPFFKSPLHEPAAAVRQLRALG